MKKWDYLLESDVTLRQYARAYASNPTDENAHRLAREYVRTHGGVPPKPGGKTATTAIGRNQVEVVRADGTWILVSYGTQVAAKYPNGDYVKTSKRHSATTTRHINKWLRDNHATGRVREVPQEELDQL